jgi:lipoprotein-anchoring transpeptidase ErfK/SrfK
MPFRSLVLALMGVAGVTGAVGACSDPKTDSSPAPKDPAPLPPPTLRSGDARDAGTVANKDAGAAPYTGPLLGALFLQTPVMSDMEWPKDDSRKPGDKSTGVRLGYLRQGAKVPVIPEAHPKANCKEGWYELVQGGFVCGKYATLDANHPRIKLAPHAPEANGPLPYQYGYNVANGTPLYRTIPSREERINLEPWLTGRKPRREEAMTPPDLDAGTAPPAFLRTATVDPAAAPQDLDSGVPWYLREYDGGKPQVTLDDLKGDGPVARRMVKGFFLALDKDFGSNGSKWWKTTGGLIAPFDRVMVYTNASSFHGLWLDAPPEEAQVASNGDAGASPPGTKKDTPDLCKPGSKAQVGVILSTRAHKYIVSVSRKVVTTGDSIPRHAVVRLTGDQVSVNGAEYDETDEGWWMKRGEAAKTKPGDPPKDLKPGEKWIDVNVTSQTLVAYEGDKAVYATAVSTGKRNDEDKEQDHRTPPGTFQIREKHVAATMDGDVASDGPYSIEDVPWIMYYSGSYALHGAFWHNNFGHTKSHGCVNLAPQDAKAMFQWTEPKLPEGWHGVQATAENPGTRVVIHE